MLNILLVLCFGSMLLYFFMLLVEKKPSWFQNRSSKRLREIEEAYEKLRNQRR